MGKLAKMSNLDRKINELSEKLDSLKEERKNTEKGRNAEEKRIVRRQISYTRAYLEGILYSLNELNCGSYEKKEREKSAERIRAILKLKNKEYSKERYPCSISKNNLRHKHCKVCDL